MRARARRLLCLILLAGCASGPGRIALPAADDPAALARAECATSVTPGDSSEAVRVGVEQGALASLYFVLRGAADRSASAYVAYLKPAAKVPAILSWRWKTDALVPGADNRDKTREDAPLRVIVAFDGDRATLPEVEQKRFKRAKNLSGKDLPYAMLMYIWSDQAEVESVIPSAHTSQIKMLVVASGTRGLGSWQSVRRNVAEDYRRVYGAEPGPALGVAVMTDTDNTGKKAVGEYADIRFECEGN